MAKVKNDKIGRPSKKTPFHVGKLVAAFQRGFNIREACHYAGINPDTYYEWKKDDAFFSEQMAKAQERMNVKAKENVSQLIEAGDPSMSRWWLEKKASDEFKSRTEIEPAAESLGELKDIVEIIRNANRDSKPNDPTRTADQPAIPTGNGEEPS